jgi:hypothetical protein
VEDRQDRERALERLLPQMLAETSGAGQPGCVDAETLAAWSSGTLRASDAAQVEAHLADCAHCQAVLGTFVRTAPPAAAPDRVWTRWHLRWLVPLATAATALTVYLLLPGGDLTRAPETMVSMTDARRDTPAAVPTPQPERPGTAALPAPAPIEVDRPSQSRAPAPATSVGAVASPERRRAAADAAAPAEAARAREAEDRVAVMAPAPPTPKVESRQEAQTLMEKAAAEPAPAAPARPAAVAAPAPAAPAGPAPPAAPTAAGAPAQVAGARRPDAAFSVLPQVGLDVDIPSPLPTHRYRIVGGQRVERTTTGGKTWEAVARPIAGEMTAGSAPAIDVCWIVGRVGAVWRTIDGQVLVRLPFPEPRDLIRVTAESATTATVTAADGRMFRTNDGGKTWR